MKSIETKHGTINLPAFMPDATYGSIRTASFPDIRKAGIEQIVTTTLHLEQKIGSQYIKKMGGIHKFFNWDRPILSDSGGWQVFSLINRPENLKSIKVKGQMTKRNLDISNMIDNSSKKSKESNTVKEKASSLHVKKKSVNFITDLGCTFIDPENGDSSLLTPESSLTIQFNLGADIMTVLDNPVIGDASLHDRTESVRITTNWAERSKKRFDELVTRDESLSPDEIRPLLGCVIQGADDFKLRKQSAEELLALDFDLYNFGGIPMMSEVTWRTNQPTGFYKEMLHYVSELIPSSKIKYAMGVGQPEDIAFCVEVGWDLFDTVLPTRNARHGYLYVSAGQGDAEKQYVSVNKKKSKEYSLLHLKSERYKYDERPVDENCDCECCKTVSRAYLRHLIRIKEPAGQRFTTIHNLRFYAKWMDGIKNIKV